MTVTTLEYHDDDGRFTMPVEFPNGPPQAEGDWLVWYVGEERLEGRVIRLSDESVRIEVGPGDYRRVYL